jgi:N4-(beta-N-acetylglucosaminyl)-L-asparaginase
LTGRDPTPDPLSRRSFLATAAAGAGGLLASTGAGGAPLEAAEGGRELGAAESEADLGAGSGMPVVIASGNGLRATDRAMQMIRTGADTLDAVVAGVNIVEEDPEDTSVGYGGLPNEEGVVELDASVMHGPTWRAGAVAALQKIKTPASVARLVMQRTDHVLLTGEGALKFAIAHGFEPVNLLTDRARREWLKWKENLSADDDWIAPPEAGGKGRSQGTINCLALNEKGDLSGVTSTSGLAFKLPGRVGDSPIIGAGLYVDNDAGAAGATGRGEAVLLAGGSRIIVENLRRGLAPAAAIRDVLERIARQTLDPRLRDAQGRPKFDVTFYALDKSGRFASGSLWKGKKFTVHDGKKNELRESFHLYEREGG